MAAGTGPSADTVGTAAVGVGIAVDNFVGEQVGTGSDIVITEVGTAAAKITTIRINTGHRPLIARNLTANATKAATYNYCLLYSATSHKYRNY